MMGVLDSYERKKCKHGRKRGIRNSIILPTLSYTSETWTWNAAQLSRIREVEMSYLWVPVVCQGGMERVMRAHIGGLV